MDSIVNCPFCNRTLPQSELQRHANSHFEEEDDEQLAQEFALESSSSSSSSSNEKVSCLIGLQVRSSFHHVKVDSGGGLMALLRQRLKSDTDNTNCSILLSGYVDHYQSLPSEDAGWGCGWRNIQMLSSHLLYHRQDAKQLLFGGSCFVPDIPYLQRWLEIAWERGFDALGAHHFNHSVYGSKTRIGTTECAALFRSFGLRAKIVDFGPKELKSLFLSVPGAHIGSQVEAPNVYGPMDRYLIRRNGNVSQPDSPDTGCLLNHSAGGRNQAQFSGNSEGRQVLLDWVWNYFLKGSLTTSAHYGRVTVTDRAPLYFQHDGHSRTIVGIEVRRQQNDKLQYNLLILDPGHRTAALERSLKENVGWKKLIKRGIHTLRKPQYQLCYIDPGVATGEEIEKLKTMDSSYIEF